MDVSGGQGAFFMPGLPVAGETGTGMANTTLTGAKRAKNDEFYTQYADIEREVNAYLEFDPGVFRGKSVLLPCDDPEWSNFTRYFSQNFTALGLRRLVSTGYAIESKRRNGFLPGFLPESDDSPFLTRGKILTLDRDTTGDGRIDLDDIEVGYLEGDGDFRSPEVRALRDETDVIVTNPPFSLFREFIPWIMEAGKRFLVIGNLNAVTYAEMFPHIKAGRIWLGATGNGSDMVFGVPQEAEVSDADRAKAAKLGYRGDYTRLGNSCWYTNLDHGQRHEPLQLMTRADNEQFSRHRTIRERGYPHYENYDAIEVPFVDAIPSDWDGVMGVPRSFLASLNPDQYEIIGIAEGESGKALGVRPVPKSLKKRNRSLRDGQLYYFENGVPVKPYARILIRKRKAQ